MTTYTKSGSFGWSGGGKAGAIVDLWAASRFGSFPIQGQAPPTGSPDAGPVTTGSDDGNPGGYLLTGIPSVQDYYVRIQYGGTAYWGGVAGGSLAGQGGGAGGGAVTLIASQVLSVPATTITFSSIPATFNHLRLVVLARSSDAAELDTWGVQLNGDTGNNYAQAGLRARGSDGAPTNVAGITQPAWNSASLLAASATAGLPARLQVEIPAYTQTTFNKMASWESGYLDLPTNVTFYTVTRQECIWNNTAVVNSIKVYPFVGPNLVAGSCAYLYGIT